MILYSTLASITSSLDAVRLSGKTISSHVKLKEDALRCLKGIIDKAPTNEYKNLLRSKNCDILLGYLMSLMCDLAKCDKSRTVRLNALEVIEVLVRRLGEHHNIIPQTCAVSSLVSAMPGVSSTLFKIVMSDTKLPHNLLTQAIRTLTIYTSNCFKKCSHQDHFEGENLITVCENLAVRIRFLIEYILNNSQELHQDIQVVMAEFVKAILTDTHAEMINRTTPALIRFIATSASQSVTDQLAMIFEEKSNDHDLIIIRFLFKTIENLQKNGFDMLMSERHSELAAITGIFRILSCDSITAFLSVPDRREQLMGTLARLAEFSTQQPLLFLSNSQVGDGALELRNEQVYTIERRFLHLTDLEVKLICTCCMSIGQKCDWLTLNDLIKNELILSDDPSKLYLAQQMTKGILTRQISQDQAFRFSVQFLNTYLDKIQSDILRIDETDSNIYSREILKTVISIETITVIIELLSKNIPEESPKHSIVLRSILCPILVWASSKSRAISETSLSSLTTISQFYRHASTQEFIRSNIDYIVDGVSEMLDNFSYNSQVTSVLAITFKLSSLEIFYYFKDVYERVFRLLETFHCTAKSIPIALLFYRTLSILCEWKNINTTDIGDSQIPLQSESSVRAIIESIDFDRQIKKLRIQRSNAKAINQEITEMQTMVMRETANELSESKMKDLLQEAKNQCEEDEGINSDVDKKQNKPNDIILAEKIIKHCVGLMSSTYDETKILALRTAALGFKILQDDEDTLLPLVHQLWSPLCSRLNGSYRQNLEINSCAFECLVTMAFYSKDFIQRRTLDCILPKICLFLESQAVQSKGEKEFGPYCMTMAYKSQLKLLKLLGPLAHNIQLAYSCLWRVVKVLLQYLDRFQVPQLRDAARTSLHFLIALDADCVWYFAKKANCQDELPFELIYALHETQ